MIQQPASRSFLPGALIVSSLVLFAPVRGLSEQLEATTYAIGVGDVLSVKVWKNDELSVTAPVRPDGRISLPLVGELDVVGRTTASLRSELTEAYGQFVAAPAVSLTIDEINSRRVFIIGEVTAAGVYDILQPTKLMQALAMAGGLSEYAKKDQVIVLRDHEGRDQRILVSIKGIESGKRSEDNIYLQPGDTIVVP